MSPDDLQPLLRSTGLEHMAQAISLNDGFQLLILEVASPGAARAAQRLLIQRAEALTLEPIPWVRLDPYRSLAHPDDLTLQHLAVLLNHLYQADPPPPPPDAPDDPDTLWDAQSPSPPGTPLLWILDLCRAPHEDAHQRLWRWFFQRLNEGRNTLTRALHASLLLCTPPHISSFWPFAAPDLWSIRTYTKKINEHDHDLLEEEYRDNVIHALTHAWNNNPLSQMSLQDLQEGLQKLLFIFKTLKYPNLQAFLIHKIKNLSAAFSPVLKAIADLYSLAPKASPIRSLNLQIIQISTLRYNILRSIDPSTQLGPDLQALGLSERLSILAVNGDLIEINAQNFLWNKEITASNFERSFFYLNSIRSHVKNIQQTFIIPGNQDVIYPLNRRLEINLRYNLKNDEAVDRIMYDPRMRDRCFARLNAYRDAVDAYLGPPPPKQDRREWTTHLLDIEGRQVGIACLNSVWRSRGGLHNDKGALLISRFQVTQALKALERADFKVALIHHPFDWLAPHEADAMRALFLEHFQLTLHGHWHHDTIQPTVDPQTQHVILPGGALNPRAPGVIGYNVIDLAQGVVFARRYDAAAGKFGPDVLSFPPDGVWRLPWYRAEAGDLAEAEGQGAAREGGEGS